MRRTNRIGANAGRHAAGALVIACLLGAPLAQAEPAPTTCFGEVAVPDGGSISGITALKGGDILVRSATSVFRYDPATRRLVAISGADPGAPGTIYVLPDGGGLMDSEHGWFHYDPATVEWAFAGKAMEKGQSGVPAGHGEPASFHDQTRVLPLPNDSDILRSEEGLVRFDRASGRVSLISPDRFDWLQPVPGNGVLLGRREPGDIERLDTVSWQIAPVGGVKLRHPIFATPFGIPGVSTMFSTRDGLFWFDPQLGEIAPIAGAEGLKEDIPYFPVDVIREDWGGREEHPHVFVGLVMPIAGQMLLIDLVAGHAHPIPGPRLTSEDSSAQLPRDDSLNGSREGIFYFDSSQNTFTKISSVPTKALEAIPLADGSFAVITDHGMYQWALGEAAMSPIAGQKIGPIPVAFAAGPRGLEWIGDETGLFVLDPATRRLNPILGASLGAVFNIHPIADGGALVLATGGTYRIMADRRIVLLGRGYGPSWFWDLPGGSELVELGNGTYRLEPDRDRLELLGHSATAPTTRTGQPGTTTAGEDALLTIDGRLVVAYAPRGQCLPDHPAAPAPH